MKRAFVFPILLLLAALFAGCSSIDTAVAPGRSLAGVQRFFILSNGNDNHALDRQIADIFRARGLIVENGPRTMMPEETQAIVAYQDHWTWDFGEHLVYLQVSIRDVKSSQPYATATFSTKVPSRQPPAGIVAELVGQLLAK